MRLLLDECVTKRLKRDFIGHEVFTVDEAGLKGLKNGQLLRAAAGKFDVLVTVDQNLPYQQNVKALTIAILVLAAKRHNHAALRPLIAQALESLHGIEPGDVITVKGTTA